MSEPKSVYRTFQIWIKPGHRLYPYLEQVCQDAKNLYNTTNFYIRQVFTAFRQNHPLKPITATSDGHAANAHRRHE
jgi:putative transposase